MKCPICNEEVATTEQAERWGPEFAHSRCVVAYNHGKADAAPEAPAHPSVPAPWREVVKDAARYRYFRDGYMPAGDPDEWDAMDQAIAVGGEAVDQAVDAALAQLDAVEGGE